MFRTTHIRTKLAAALAVPLVALIGVAGFEVVGAKADVDAARSQAELAQSSIAPGDLLVSLQNERNRAALDLIGFNSGTAITPANNADARAAVDPAAKSLRTETTGGGAVSAAFTPAWTAFAGLEGLRADVDGFDGSLDADSAAFADDVFQRYSDIIDAFFDSTTAAAVTVDDASLRNGAEIVDVATRDSELRARIVHSLALATVVDELDAPAVRQGVAALQDRGRTFDSDIRSNASGVYQDVGAATFAAPAVQSFNRQIDAYLNDEGVDVTKLLDAMTFSPDSPYGALRTSAADVLSGEAQSLQDDAVAQERLFGAIALGALLLALLVTWLASRTITRPLRSLRSQAEAMAGTRLPQAVRRILDTPAGADVVVPNVLPITVKTKDEVAEVAAALTAVQSSAVDLAVEQAVLRRNISDSYVNLGRRNQNLLSRQLDFITDLERNETDPDTLEGLFRLDHLATRMRRNAESLLVLAGIDPPRQWSAPVKLADVVRAALGEVEDYQRVVVRHLEPAAVTGAVAADIAHVLAELIENALSFSPPEQSVEVKGRLTTDGYTLAVSDNGLGMGAEDVERANRRLAGQESFTVAPSRYLGHYVAGKLACRVGVVVELQDSPAGGITARVDVPMGLLADDELTGPLGIPAAEPVASGPTGPTGPTPSLTTPGTGPSTTASGLTRRGERPLVATHGEEAPAQAEPDAPATTPAPAERVAAPSMVDAPPTPPAARPTRGFGGLAVAPPGPSMYSVATNGTRQSPTRRRQDGPAPTPAPAPAGTDTTTATGLARRVPGVQRPDAGFSNRDAEPAPSDAEQVRTSPEDVYSFLSNFQSGVARGRADAATGTETDTDTETEEGV